MPAERFSSSRAPREHAHSFSAACGTHERHATSRQKDPRQKLLCCEPVSGWNSLITGKIAGKFRRFRSLLRLYAETSQQIQWPVRKFPTQRSTEFSEHGSGNCSSRRSELRKP